MASFIGIDLGTTYSAISYIDDTGRPKIIHNSEGENITSSCIAFNGANVSETGNEARKLLGIEDNVVARFKRDMGTSKKYTINGKKHTPTSLSAEILKKLYFDAKNQIGEIEEAVITVPANFAQEARDETKKAAKLAGINAKYMIDEPTAAALYYAYQGGSLNGYYAVYDLGGGTFDVSIVKIDGDDVEVVATHGIPKLGGDDFDSALQKIAQQKFNEETGEELEEQDFTKTEAEENKQSLSKRDIRIRLNRKSYDVSQAEFEDAIASMVAQTEMICETVLEEANLTIDDIEEVFLVGGSTRIPLVQQSVKRSFKMTPTATVNVDEVVCLGAALYAAIKGDRSKLNPAQKTSIEKISVSDVTPAYYGVIVQTYDEARGVDNVLEVSIVIEKNVKRPCSYTKTYYAPFDDCPELLCSVTQSMALETDPDFVNTVAEVALGPLPPGNKQGDPVEATYSYDENGFMHASFLDVNSGIKKEISLSGEDENSGSIKID